MKFVSTYICTNCAKGFSTETSLVQHHAHPPKCKAFWHKERFLACHGQDEVIAPVDSNEDLEDIIREIYIPYDNASDEMGLLTWEAEHQMNEVFNLAEDTINKTHEKPMYDDTPDAIILYQSEPQI